MIKAVEGEKIKLPVVFDTSGSKPGDTYEISIQVTHQDGMVVSQTETVKVVPQVKLRKENK